MEELLPFLIFGGVASIFVAVFGLSLYAAKKRREALEAMAAEWGLEFIAKGDGSLRHRLDRLPLFDKGRGRKTRNIIESQGRDPQICIFDYQYTTGSGKNSKTHHQTVFAFIAQSGSLPGQFFIGPESFFHGIGEYFGMQDIDLDEYPVFSKKFVLRGNDEAAARGMISDALVDLLLTERNLTIEADGELLIVYRAGRRIKPFDLSERLTLATEVYGLLHPQQG